MQDLKFTRQYSHKTDYDPPAKYIKILISRRFIQIILWTIRVVVEQV